MSNALRAQANARAVPQHAAPTGPIQRKARDRERAQFACGMGARVVSARTRARQNQTNTEMKTDAEAETGMETGTGAEAEVMAATGMEAEPEAET